MKTSDTKQLKKSISSNIIPTEQTDWVIRRDYAILLGRLLANGIIDELTFERIAAYLTKLSKQGEV